MSNPTKEDIREESIPQGVENPGESANAGGDIDSRGTMSEDLAASRPVDPTLKITEELSKLRDELTKKYEEENKLLRDRIKQLEEDKGSPVIEAMEKIRDEVESLRTKLPTTLRDEKAKIEGYYDFDSASRRYINETTNKDYNRAKSDFRMLGA